MTACAEAMAALRHVQPMAVSGRVVALRGLSVLVQDLPLPIGSLVAIARPGSGDDAPMLGEIVGFAGGQTVVMMLGQSAGISPGDRVLGLHATPTINVGDSMLGRVIDGLARPIDGHGPLHGLLPRPLMPEPMGALTRKRVTEPMRTGLRAIDIMTPLGRGQRLGIFAGPGVGKSTLLGSLARNSTCDIAVLALIGERGREVKDFVHDVLGEEGLKRSVVVAATGDESPLMRIRAANVAFSVAEHFRDRGKHVLLMLDSLTRFSHAHRQVGLSVGEPPTTKGYTPGVFAAMARLLERAGQLENMPGRPAQGSITGLFTILVEGDETTEPVSDAARGILDGHLMLSRQLAQKNHYPAIDVLDSVSRVASDVSDPEHDQARRQLGRLMAAYRDIEDLVQIGAYAKGSSAEADVAIAFYPRIREILQQGNREREAWPNARARAIKVAAEAMAALNAQQRKQG